MRGETRRTSATRVEQPDREEQMSALSINAIKHPVSLKITTSSGPDPATGQGTELKKKGSGEQQKKTKDKTPNIPPIRMAGLRSPREKRKTYGEKK